MKKEYKKYTYTGAEDCGIIFLLKEVYTVLRDCIEFIDRLVLEHRAVFLLLNIHDVLVSEGSPYIIAESSK